jgi:hypothetical protein
MKCVCNKMHLCSPDDNCGYHYGIHDELHNCTEETIDCTTIRGCPTRCPTRCLSGDKLTKYVEKHFELFL